MRKRLGAAVALTIVELVLFASPALAHVTVDPTKAVQGSFAKLTFRVPSEATGREHRVVRGALRREQSDSIAQREAEGGMDAGREHIAVAGAAGNGSRSSHEGGVRNHLVRRHHRTGTVRRVRSLRRTTASGHRPPLVPSGADVQRRQPRCAGTNSRSRISPRPNTRCRCWSWRGLRTRRTRRTSKGGTQHARARGLSDRRSRVGRRHLRVGHRATMALTVRLT